MYIELMSIQKIRWEPKYSVGVEQIDNQHKELIKTINMLIDVLGTIPTKEQLDVIIQRLIAYKRYHFVTEEKYFDEFKYEGSAEHKAKHKEFNDTVKRLIAESKEDSAILAYSLIDFLEDWLIDHLMTEDQKYVQCFHDHGLK